MIQRREFITLLGGAVATWPIAASAQPAASRIGILLSYLETDPQAQARLKIFRQALQADGWSFDRDLRVDVRWAGSNVDLIRRYARELVALGPALIVSNTTPVTAALQRETASIPIVFVAVSDPVGDGFVKSLARPGGNITGFINFEDSMGGKWLELLKEAAPKVRRVSSLFNPDTAPGGGAYFQRVVENASQSLGISTTALPVRTAADIEDAIGASSHLPDSGLLVAPDTTMVLHRKLIMSLAERYKVPAAYALGSYAAEGGLIGYGPDYNDLFRRSASYVTRILKGTSPSDLPVQAPTKFELVINLKTARAIGLEISPVLLARADEVIE